MPRKELALTRVSPAIRGARKGVLEHEDRDVAADAACLFCTMIDNDDDEPLRVRLARALAYGELVLATDGGVSTCDDCHKAIVGERRALKRELAEVEG
jgi:hypothetical protein